MLLFLFVCRVLTSPAQTPRLVIPIGHAGPVTSAAFSPNDGGRYILTGSGDNTAKLWDQAGHEILTFKGHEFVVNAAAFSPGGQSVLTGSFDGKAKLWDLSGQAIKTFSGHKNYVYSVAFSPDGKRILTGSRDKTAKLWDIETGKEIRTFLHTGAVTVVAFSSADGGKTMLTGDEEGAVKLWNVESPGKPLQSFKKHAGSVSSAVFSPDGKSVLTAGKDNTARLWDTKGRLLETFKHVAAVQSAAFSSDGQQIVTGSTDGMLRYWNLSGDLLRMYRGHDLEISAVRCTPAGAVHAPGRNFTLSGSADHTAKLWDTTGQTAAILKGFTNSITALSFSPDGKFISLGNAGGTVKQWNMSGEELKNFSITRNEASIVAVSPDGQFVLGRGKDNIFKLRDLTGRVRRVYPAFQMLTALAFSPDGQSVAGAGRDSIFIWDLPGSILHAFPVTGQINALSFSPDGKSIVSGGKNGSVQCWDLSGNELQKFGRSFEEILSVAFSPPDGPAGSKFILSGSAGGTAKLREQASGQEILTFTGNAGEVSGVGFTPDGKSAVTVHKNGTVKFWDPASGKERIMLVPLDSSDWAVTTPEGLFDASPGAMNRMYYVQGLEVIDLAQLKDRYYEPGLFARVMGLAEGELRRVQRLESQELALCPLLLEAGVEGDKIRVRLQKRDGGIGAAAVLLDDDIELIPDANPQRLESFEIDLAPYSGHFIDSQVNRLSLIFYTRDGWPPSPPYTLDYIPGGARSKGDPGAPAPSPLAPPGEKSDLANTLYALVVGTSRYAGAELNLRFPDKDAAAYKEMLELSGLALFGDRMNVKLLSTAANGTRPTKAAIQTALAEFAARAEPKDILLVYLSGHGTTWPANSPAGQFYYLTTDNSSFDFDNTGNRRHAISQDSLQAWIRAVKARKRILILDACNSGEVVRQIDIGAKGGNLNSDQRRALVRMKDRAGFFVLAGSAADKSSYEDPRFGHGLLTYSLLRNTPKVAAGDKNHYVDVGRLFMEVREDVPKLAGEVNKVQEPKLIGMEDFSIGIIKDSTAVKLPSVKKIIAKSSFRNLRQSDPLKITDAVNEQLEQMLADPTLNFAFWPVDKAAGEYHTLNGSYEVNGTAVKVTAWLYRYKGDAETELKTFVVSGVSNQVNKLIDELMGQFAEYLEGMP